LFHGDARNDAADSGGPKGRCSAPDNTDNTKNAVQSYHCNGAERTELSCTATAALVVLLFMG